MFIVLFWPPPSFCWCQFDSFARYVLTWFIIISTMLCNHTVFCWEAPSHLMLFMNYNADVLYISTVSFWYSLSGVTYCNKICPVATFISQIYCPLFGPQNELRPHWSNYLTPFLAEHEYNTFSFWISWFEFLGSWNSELRYWSNLGWNGSN